VVWCVAISFVFSGCAPSHTLSAPGEGHRLNPVLENKDVGRGVVVYLVDGGTRTGKLLDYSREALVLQASDKDLPEVINYEEIAGVRVEGPWRLSPAVGIILVGVVGIIVLFMASLDPWGRD
jgi:hypothetical protein